MSRLPPGVTQADLEASAKYDQGRVFRHNDPNALNVTMAEEFQELSQSRAEAQFRSGVSALDAQETPGGQSQGGAAGQAGFASGVSALSAGSDAGQSAGPSGGFAAGVEAVAGQEAGNAPEEGEGLSSGGAERESGGAEEGGGISGGQDMEP